jgi:hypothetical protein
MRRSHPPRRHASQIPKCRPRLSPGCKHPQEPRIGRNDVPASPNPQFECVDAAPGGKRQRATPRPVAKAQSLPAQRRPNHRRPSDHVYLQGRHVDARHLDPHRLVARHDSGIQAQPRERCACHVGVPRADRRSRIARECKRSQHDRMTTESAPHDETLSNPRWSIERMPARPPLPGPSPYPVHDVLAWLTRGKATEKRCVGAGLLARPPRSSILEECYDDFVGALVICPRISPAGFFAV